MADIKTGILLNLKGNVDERARRWGRSINRFSVTGGRDLSRFQRTAESAGRGLEKLGGRWTAMITGAAGVQAVRQVGSFSDRLTGLGIAANKSDAEMAKLRQGVLDTANKWRVAPDAAMDAIDGIIEKTGDLDFATSNVNNIAMAIQATGAAGKDVGELLAEFQKMDIKSPDEVLKALDILNTQGKEGAFTLENLAALGPRVITAYTAAGRGGTGALREMGAALQMIRQGTGSSEMAASAFEATMAALTDPAKVKALKEIAGIDVKHMENGEKILRPINEIMAEIVQKSGGDIGLIKGVLGSEQAARAFNAAAGEFNRTGTLENLEKYYSVQADGTNTQRDAERRARTYGAAMQSLSNAWRSFADGNLAGPVQSLADAINSVDPAQFQRWLTLAAKMAGLAMGFTAIAKLRRLGGGGPAAGGRGGAGGLGGGMGAPVPVMVVGGRMPAGPFGSAPGGVPGAPDTPGSNKKPGRAARLARGMNAAGAVVQAGAVGYAVGTVLNEGITLGLSKITGKHKTLGSALYDLFNDDEALANPDANTSSRRRRRGRSTPEEKQEVGGELKITIDSEGRPRIKSLEKTGFMDLNVNTGPLMGGG